MKKLYSFEIEQKANRFLQCQNMEDLRNLGFNINKIQLLSLNPPYYTFNMQKKSGGVRVIEAPEGHLKELQRTLNHHLQYAYYTVQSSASYGYIIGTKDKKIKKNILENAKMHLGANYMLKVDFKDFFHQISSAQILKLLQKPLFQFDKRTANILTRLFTYKNRLPMGAPTSPVLSNFATIEFDDNLSFWAKSNNIVYTRFVDDLTFSSKVKAFDSKHLEDITNICKAHSLKLNPIKTIFWGVNETKKVTGLVLNETIDIDQLFYNELDQDLKRLSNMAEVNMIMNKHNRDSLLREFKKEIEGKVNFIGMIEGYDSRLFYNYRKSLSAAMKPKEDILSSRWTNFNYF